VHRAIALCSAASPPGLPSATVELSGGDIRNVVVAAGYDAAIEGARPGMRHILDAAVAEYTKLGRRVPVGLLDGIRRE